MRMNWPWRGRWMSAGCSVLWRVSLLLRLLLILLFHSRGGGRSQRKFCIEKSSSICLWMCLRTGLCVSVTVKHFPACKCLRKSSSCGRTPDVFTHLHRVYLKLGGTGCRGSGFQIISSSSMNINKYSLTSCLWLSAASTLVPSERPQKYIVMFI